MTTLSFSRAGWLLQITRTSRNISFSLSASVPRRSLHTPLRELPRRHRSAAPTAPSIASYLNHRAFASQAIRRQGNANAAAEALSSEGETISNGENSADLSSGFRDAPADLGSVNAHVDWSRSFHGLSTEAFSADAKAVLLAPIDPHDVEVKPDGIVYLPEIKYRRILNKAFGPGAWGLAPRSETIVTSKAVTREYGLLVLGRLVSVARGEQDYFGPENIPTATEGCKSNALLRCCKDLGVASELWDPRWIRGFMDQHVRETWAENMVTKKKRKLFVRKDEKLRSPWKETKF